MTYFDLRKRDPDPGESTDEDGEPVEIETPDDNPPGTSRGFAGALWAGISGPGAWLTARGKPGLAWLLYVGSVWAVSYYGGWLAFGIVTAWLGAILAFIPREHLERGAAAIERLGERCHQPPAKDAPEAGEEQPLNPIVPVMWKLIADAPGVHLKTLAKHLQAAAPGTPIDRAAVRAKLNALGIPIKASVRDAAGKVNEGVHRDGLRAWEQALPQAAPTAPSGPRSGPVATALTCDVGNRREDVATPLSHLRRLWPRGGA